jgi:hypothetical protein
MKPEKKRKHSPYTRSHNTILVEFTAEMVPHDSPEFRERARQAAERPIPDYLRQQPKPDTSAPPSA